MCLLTKWRKINYKKTKNWLLHHSFSLSGFIDKSCKKFSHFNFLFFLSNKSNIEISNTKKFIEGNWDSSVWLGFYVMHFAVKLFCTKPFAKNFLIFPLWIQTIILMWKIVYSFSARRVKIWFYYGWFLELTA